MPDAHPCPPHPRTPPRRRRVAAGVVALSLVFAACGSDDVGSTRSGTADQLPPDAAAAAQVGESLTDVGPALYRAVAATENGNVAVAPWPATDVLAQVRAGAEGATLDELSSALTLDGADDRSVLRGLGTIAGILDSRLGEQANDQRRGTITLETATGLWIQRGTTLDDDWLDLLSAGLGRGVHLVDFRSDPESSRRAVNSWARDETNGAIDQLVLRGVVTADTRLLAATALWLQAPWAQSFDVTRTVSAPFARLDGSTIDVASMRLDARLRSTTGDGLDAVELPYLGGDLSMLVIVPAAGRYDEVESSLDAAMLDDVIAALRPQPTSVRLPRFGFTTEARLDHAVVALGAGRAFSPIDAELDRMAPGEPLSLSAVVQQVFISVDEEGTQASAATVADVTGPTLTDTVAVSADRPFLFLVRDRRSNTPLLIGRVLDPSA